MLLDLLQKFTGVFSLQRRDPRFDPRCGEYDERVFRQTYRFLNDVKASEKQTLQEALNEAYENEDFEKATRLKHELKVMVRRFSCREQLTVFASSA